MSFTTRITTGSLKGKVLHLPHNEAVRPTRERVRQAIFNMLGSRLDWPGMTVADLCCGSGAWGLEAFSRGAAEVWLIDSDTRAVTANVKALGLHDNPHIHIVQADAGSWHPPHPLDVILADPPYQGAVLSHILANAAALGNAGSWWAVEYAAAQPPAWPQAFSNLAHKAYGISGCSVGQFFPA